MQEQIYAIAGATGRVGSATAQRLLTEGAGVRVLVRTEDAAEDWKARGADTRIVDLRDADELSDAISGCAGLFVLLPFDLTAHDLEAHAVALTSSISSAVASAGVAHVVVLSSGGADLAEGTGPISTLYRFEQALLASGTKLTALRAGHFQEKVSDVIGAAQAEGIYPVFSASADIAHPMIATQELGSIAAGLLQHPPVHSENVDVLGRTYTEREVAILLGNELGQELQVIVLPEESWAGALVDAGLPAHAAQSLAELYQADDRGLLAPRGDRSIQGSTRLEATIASLLNADAAV